MVRDWRQTLVTLHPLITLPLYFTLRKTVPSADQRPSQSHDVGSQSDSHPTPCPSEQGWVYHYWQAVFISPITVQVETPEHKFLAQPWLPADVAAVELRHICKARVTDASFLAFCLRHELSKLERGLHQSFGSKHCRQLGISQATCSPCLHQPMSHTHPPCAVPAFHPQQLFPWAFESCGIMSTEVLTSWFPKSRRNQPLPTKRKHLLNQNTFSNL